MGYMNRFHNPFTVMTFEEWARRKQPFHFVADIEGLPPAFNKDQNTRLRQMEFVVAAQSRVSDQITINALPCRVPAGWCAEPSSTSFRGAGLTSATRFLHGRPSICR
jgi:hypothetical protein